jgi:hypothetical protein
MRITLVRFESSDDGTFGIIELEQLKIYTLERPWKDNKVDISCVPRGTYLCKYTYSNRFKRSLYELKDVKDRSGIRIHPANYQDELKGCIALGIQVSDHPKKHLLSSKVAVEMFENILKKEDFELEIIERKLPTVQKRQDQPTS